MNTNISQLVHENEAQRRHARVKLPVTLIMGPGEGKNLDILDISVSGFSVRTPDGLFQLKNHYSGILHFQVNRVEFRLPIQFMVVYCAEGDTRAGCTFDGLGPDELSLLHLFVGKYISGELVTNDDIISTISRENFVRPRNNGKAGALQGWGKVRALAGTSLAACIGLAAFGFISLNLYDHYFLTRAVSAMVDIDKEVIEAPANGYVDLISGDPGAVEKGKPMADIFSPALEVLAGTSSHLSSEDIVAMLPQQFHSVVKSPWDGRIIGSQADDQTYVKKGDPLFILARKDATPFIRATFRYDDADELPVGQRVRLQFPGAAESFSGIIEDINVDLESTASQLVAVIRPDDDLSYDQLQKPVYVMVYSVTGQVPIISSSIKKLSSLKSALVRAN